MSICNLHFRLLWWILLITGRSRTAPSFPAGDLETHPGLSRHHPVEHFLGKAFTKAHYAHLSPVTTCCPGFCQGSQLWRLPFVTECCLFPPGHPSILRAQSCWNAIVVTPSRAIPLFHLGHRACDDGEEQPGCHTQSWAHQPSSPSSGELGNPHGRCCSGAQQQRQQMAPRAFQSFLSSLQVSQPCLSPVWGGKGLESWKMLWLSLCHGWQPYPLFANEQQE